MKKAAIAALLALGALLGTFLLSNSAFAYPDVQISMRSDREVVRSGEAFTVSAVSNVDCAWELSWNHDSRASSGADFTTKFVAPDVTAITKLPLTGDCTYDKASSAGRAAASSPQNLTITVLPPVDGTATQNQNNASLAGTGGPDRVVLLSGVILLFAGATVAMVARRRAEDAELPGRTV